MALAFAGKSIFAEIVAMTEEDFIPKSLFQRSQSGEMHLAKPE